MSLRATTPRSPSSGIGSLFEPLCRSGLAIAGAIAVAALVAGCIKNVPQNGNSGKDARAKGAKAIELENGDGSATDIVTYPGGDRVDWKMIELPEGKKGQLRIRIRFRPARPGMDVAFNVYDEYFAPVKRVKPSNRGGKTRKGLKIKDARGKYFVQIYAPRRKDAAKYKLEVRFEEKKPPIKKGDAELLAQIDDPPPLPSVPEPVVDPLAGQPGGALGPGGAGAGGAIPTGPDPTGGPGGAGAGGTDPEPALAGPVKAKVRKVQTATGGGVVVTLNKGKNAGVARGWRGKVLRGSSDEPLVGGDFKVIRVTKRESVAKIRLTVDQVRSNPNVLLTP